MAFELSGTCWNRRCLGTIKRKILHSASISPHSAPFEVSKGVPPLLPPNQEFRSAPTLTRTLTLALELADDGVQVRVLGRDVAPADRHLSAATSARSHQPPGSLRLHLSSGSAASGSGWALPPEWAAGLRAPPARLRLPSAALPAPPSQARGSRASLPGLQPRSCPRGGAERSREAAGRGSLGGGNFSPTRRGRGGALTPRGRSWAEVLHQGMGRGSSPELLSAPVPLASGLSPYRTLSRYRRAVHTLPGRVF